MGVDLVLAPTGRGFEVVAIVLQWDTATALLGDPQPQRTAWILAYWEPQLAGQLKAITALQDTGRDPT
jgi:hypothetical protein